MSTGFGTKNLLSISNIFSSSFSGSVGCDVSDALNSYSSWTRTKNFEMFQIYSLAYCTLYIAHCTHWIKCDLLFCIFRLDSSSNWIKSIKFENRSISMNIRGMPTNNRLIVRLIIINFHEILHTNVKNPKSEQWNFLCEMTTKE